MRYVYRIVSFFALFVLFAGCGNEKNNEKKIESKAYSSSSKSCFVDTRSIFKNINAPVFAPIGDINVYKGRLDVVTLNATANNGGTIKYYICGRGAVRFRIDNDSGKIKVENTDAPVGTYKFIALAKDSKDNKTTSKVVTVNILESIAPSIKDANDTTFIMDNEGISLEIKNTGGAITTSSITPALLGTLEFSCTEDICKIDISSTSDGLISDSDANKNIPYSIMVENFEGSETIGITIKYPVAPNIWSNLDVVPTYKRDESSSSWTFSNLDEGGVIKICTISPTIPGLTIDNKTCTITGTPTMEQNSISHTISATNAGGSKKLEFNIQVLIVPYINDITEAKVFEINKEIEPIYFDSVVTLSGCHVAPLLPSGLSAVSEGTRCKISGTPLVYSDATEYTVKALYKVSNDTATVTITVE